MRPKFSRSRDLWRHWRAAIPMIGAEYSRLHLLDEVCAAALCIRHDHEPLAFSQMAKDHGLEAPIASTMIEIPLVALTDDTRSHGEVAHADRREHLSGRIRPQHRALLTRAASLEFDHETRQIA